MSLPTAFCTGAEYCLAPQVFSMNLQLWWEFRKEHKVFYCWEGESQADLWFCLILWLNWVKHIPPHLLPSTRGEVAPLSGTWETPPISKADTDPKNCFVLWWMDFFFFFSTYFATLSSWENRDHELVTLLLLVVGRVEGRLRLCHVSRESAFPAGSRNRNDVFGYHLFSIIAISVFC